MALSDDFIMENSAGSRSLDEGPTPAEIHNFETRSSQAAAAGDIASISSLIANWKSKYSFESIYVHSAFMNSLNANNVPIVSSLLSHGYNLRIYHVRVAVEMKSYHMLKALLDHGWDINEPVSRLEPPLLSLTYDDEELTDWFLGHGANINARCGMDITPLSAAVEVAPSLAFIKKLIDRGGNIYRGQLLHHAVERDLPDRLEVIDFLVDQGCSLNGLKYHDCPNDYHLERFVALGTPLHYAAWNGKVDVIQRLLQRGADPTIPDTNSHLPIDCAAYNHHDEAVEVLRPLTDAFSRHTLRYQSKYLTDKRQSMSSPLTPRWERIDTGKLIPGMLVLLGMGIALYPTISSISGKILRS